MKLYSQSLKLFVYYSIWVMRPGKWKHLVIVSFFLIILILNTTSLSATNRMSAHRTFADDCYDSDGNYICSDMSDGNSNADSGDNSDGNTGAESSDSGSDSGTDSSHSTGGDNSGESPDGNLGSRSNDLSDGNTGNDGSPDTSGDTNGGDNSGETEGDSGTNCNDEEGNFVCPSPSQDENLPKDNSPPSERPLNNGTEGDKSQRKDSSQSPNEPSFNMTNATIGDGGVNLPSDTAPIARIGPDKEVSEGTTLTIDGSKSSDPNGDELQYYWQTTKDEVSPEGPELSIGDTNGEKLQVSTPDVNSPMTYIIALTVTDKDGNSDYDSMSLIVRDKNSPLYPIPIPCEEDVNHTNPDCPQPNPIPQPCNAMMNVTEKDCPEPNPEPVPCDQDTNYTNPNCPPQPNPEPQPCEIDGNITNATGQECLPNSNPGLNNPLLNSTKTFGPNMTKLTINNTDVGNSLNLTLPNLNRTEVGFRNGTEILNATLPIFNFSKIGFGNATMGNLTGFYYENGTSAILNDTLIPLSNGTLLSLNNTNLSPFQEIISVAGSVYSQSLIDIQAARGIATTIQSIGDLAGGLKLLHIITCNDFIKISCIPFPFADDIVNFILDAANYLSSFLKNYDFDRSVTVFQDGKNLLGKMNNSNDTQALALVGVKNEEAIYWMSALSNDFWVKNSKGIAATIGDVVVWAGKIKGDNSWIQTGQKIKTLHDDLVQDSSSLFKIQNMIKSYLGKQGPSTPTQPPTPKGKIKLPPIPPKSDGNDGKKIVKKNTQKTLTTTKREGLANYYYIGKIGLPGSGKGQLLEPTDVGVDILHNLLYVADKSNNRIDVFDTNGQYLKSWGSPGAGIGQFNNPADLASDFGRGLIFVSDIGNNRVEKFDTNGKFLGMWGSSGTRLGQFDHTGDISLDPVEKMVYLTDIGNHRVQKFDYDGNFIKSWGALGTGNGQFNRPAGLTFDSSAVYVADTKNNRIQKFDKEGNFLQSWGIQGKGLGQLQNPVSIAAEPDSDYLYVTHGGDKRIEVFDKHGKYVISWGSAGVGNGQLKRAVSVAFGNDNKIFVADKDKSEIDVFGVVYQSHPSEIKKTTTTKTTTTKAINVSGKDDSNKKSSTSQVKKKNDPCNYHGLDVCDKDRKVCDNHRFDCLSDNCNDGKPGTTGLCDGDDDTICWKNGEYLNKCYPANGQHKMKDNNDNNKDEGYQLLNATTS